MYRFCLETPLAAGARGAGGRHRRDRRALAWRRSASAASTGIVKDDTGAVLPGVTVTITNKQTGKVYTVVTGSDGVYRVLDLEPGRYSVRFELTGFSTAENARTSNLLLGKTLDVSPVDDGGRRERGRHASRRVAAHRHQEHDHRAQRDGRGDSIAFRRAAASRTSRSRRRR